MQEYNGLSYTKTKDADNLHFDFNENRCEIKYFEEQQLEPIHKHDFDELVVILGGSALHVIDDEKFPVIRGDVFVVRGDHRHTFRKLNHLNLANFLFRRDYFNSLKKEFAHLPGFQALFVNEPLYRKNQKFKSKLHLNSGQLNELSQLIENIKTEKEEASAGSKEIIERIFEFLVLQVCRFYSEGASSSAKALLRISAVLDFMENNYMYPVSVSELAKKSAMAESNFRHSFKKITGLSPIDYLTPIYTAPNFSFLIHSPNIFTPYYH